jgi:hypothetical protein
MRVPDAAAAPAALAPYARADAFLEARARAIFWILAATAVVLAAITAANRPLDHDEVFTHSVASQGSPAAIYAALRSGADNHPPLDYCLRSASMVLFGGSEFGLRLPSVLAFAGVLACTFALIRRLWGAAAGLAGTAVVLASQGNSYAYFGRSYEFVLLCTAAGLLLWRMAATGEHRPVALIALAVIFAAVPALHYYAPFNVAAVVVAEVVRTTRRRRIDWAIWGAFACSIAGVVVDLPLLAYAQSFTKGFWTPVTIEAALAIYRELFQYGIPAIFGVIVVYAAVRYSGTGVPQRDEVIADNAAAELAAAVWLVALPFVIFVLARAGTGALMARYCIAMVLGAALLAAYAARHAPQFRVSFVPVVAAFAIAVMGAKAVSAAKAGHIKSEVAALYDIARATDLPVVIDVPQTFLESSFYADAPMRKRLFYLVDMESATRIQGQNTDQRVLPHLARITGYQAVALDDFLRQTHRFVLVYTGGWQLQRILEDSPRVSLSYHKRTMLATIEMPVTTVPGANSPRRQ